MQEKYEKTSNTDNETKSSYLKEEHIEKINMIPKVYITEWRKYTPWLQDMQVEQDLLISRALIEIFQEPHLADALAFRGGAAWR